MTYHQLIFQAYSLLEKKLRNPQVAFQLLYGLDNKINDSYSFSNNRLTIVNSNLEYTYFKLLDEFINGKPLVRILGYGYFCAKRFYVDKNVFAFRVETELLIDVVNKVIQQSTYKIKNVIDVCCGSGDKSMQEYFLNTKKRFDLIICNPPYIKSNYELNREVLDYDPINALIDFDHKDGISFYLFIINNIKSIANEKFTIIFEIGFDQKEILEKVIKKNEFPLFYYFINDYNNLCRILIISNIKYENL